MTATEMSVHVNAFFEHCVQLQWKKNKDYHPDNVAFLEILKTAADCRTTVEQVLWGQIRKQMVALQGFMVGGTLESEPPVSRMTDIAVYMGMSAFWVENRERVVKDAAEFVRSRRSCEHSDGQFTCIGQDRPKADRCDRCNFLQWLLNDVVC